MTSYFEVLIETNLMVQSEFNFVFWFVSYNIFLASSGSGAHHACDLSSLFSLLSAASSRSSAA
jgi:hypothetical protein